MGKDLRVAVVKVNMLTSDNEEKSSPAKAYKTQEMKC